MAPCPPWRYLYKYFCMFKNFYQFENFRKLWGIFFYYIYF